MTDKPEKSKLEIECNKVLANQEIRCGVIVATASVQELSQVPPRFQFDISYKGIPDDLSYKNPRYQNLHMRNPSCAHTPGREWITALGILNVFKRVAPKHAELLNNLYDEDVTRTRKITLAEVWRLERLERCLLDRPKKQGTILEMFEQLGDPFPSFGEDDA